MEAFKEIVRKERRRRAGYVVRTDVLLQSRQARVLYVGRTVLAGFGHTCRQSGPVREFVDTPKVWLRTGDIAPHESAHGGCLLMMGKGSASEIDSDSRVDGYIMMSLICRIE